MESSSQEESECECVLLLVVQWLAAKDIVVYWLGKNPKSKLWTGVNKLQKSLGILRISQHDVC